MNVRELMTKLKDMDPDAEVRFGERYGDRVRSVVARPVKSVEEATLVWSTYHDEFKVPSDEHPPEDDDETLEAVVLR